MQVLELLTKGREIITPPEAWTQGAFARIGDDSVEPDNAKATCWCSLGAIYRLTTLDHDLRNEAEGLLDDAAAPHGVINFNDEHTHEEVLAMWDRAIEAAK